MKKIVFIFGILSLNFCFKVNAMENNNHKYDKCYSTNEHYCEIKDSKTGKIYSNDMFLNFNESKTMGSSEIVQDVLDFLDYFLKKPLTERFENLNVCENEEDYLVELFSKYAEEVVLQKAGLFFKDFGYEGKSMYDYLKNIVSDFKKNLKLVIIKGKDDLGIFNKKRLKVLKNNFLEYFTNQYFHSLDVCYSVTTYSNNIEMISLIGKFYFLFGKLKQFIDAYNSNIEKFFVFYKIDSNSFINSKKQNTKACII